MDWTICKLVNWIIIRGKPVTETIVVKTVMEKETEIVNCLLTLELLGSVKSRPKTELFT